MVEKASNRTNDREFPVIKVTIRNILNIDRREKALLGDLKRKNRKGRIRTEMA